MKLLILILTLSSFVTDLMSRMTLDEKIGQLNLLVAPSEIVTGENQSDNIFEKVTSGSCGGVFNVIGCKSVMSLQKAAVDQSRLGIPLLFGLDVIHGYKTIYPVPLGLAATWNLELVERVSRMSAVEASADGINWLYGPMVDIARDPRWGRCVESPGEDPYMNGQYAAAIVRGCQGDLSDDSEILACVKHFALYGAAESGRDYNETDMSPDRMYNVYLEPYRAAVEAGVHTVMGSFNDVNGIPASTNRWLLTEVLRKQWGFDGFVVSDYNAVQELSAHGLGNAPDVSKRSLEAGMDMDMVCEYFLKHLPSAVKNGEIPIAAVDEACGRILEVKYRLGLFDDPYKFIKDENSGRIYSKEASDLSLKAAEESFVLLKNSSVLPLRKGTRVALTGPFADAGAQYAGSWAAKALEEYPSLLDVMGDCRDLELRFARGSNIMDRPEDEKNATGRRKYVRDLRKPEAMLKEAVKAARRSDVVVACLGEGAYMTGESNCRTSLGLPDCQRVLLEKLLETGKPVVLVLFSGRPMDLSREDEQVAAILDVWYGGSRSAEAIANVLTGKVNPSGRLTMTFPRNVGQIPIYYSHRPLGRPNKGDDGFNRYRSCWLDSPTTPLYPFGYGLSYTEYEYSDVTLSSEEMSADGSVTARVSVRNAGDMDGDETVQLYIRDLVSSSTRPVKELKAFRKVHIPAGESCEVEFEITPEMLSWYYVDQYNLSCSPKPLVAEKTLEPGEFEILIGHDSRVSRAVRLVVL